MAVNGPLILIYLNQNDYATRFNAKKYYLPKGIFKNYNIIVNGKNFYEQWNDSDVKWYEETRKING